MSIAEKRCGFSGAQTRHASWMAALRWRARQAKKLCGCREGARTTSLLYVHMDKALIVQLIDFTWLVECPCPHTLRLAWRWDPGAWHRAAASCHRGVQRRAWRGAYRGVAQRWGRGCGRCHGAGGGQCCGEVVAGAQTCQLRRLAGALPRFAREPAPQVPRLP